MEKDMQKLYENLISITTDIYRFQKLFENVVEKMAEEDRARVLSQYQFYKKRFKRFFDETEIKVISFDNQEYDPGMAVTPINIEEFESSDKLYIVQTIEPTILLGNKVHKTGTVILGRIDR